MACVVFQAQNELMEAMKAETFYEGDNPLSFTDEDHAFVAMVQQETEAQMVVDQTRNKVGTDFEGLPMFAVSRITRSHTVVAVAFVLRRIKHLYSVLISSIFLVHSSD